MSGGAWSYNRFDAYEKQLAEKKADKDYDGDGKVESSKDEYFGSKDKAIKKAMGKSTKKESKDDDCECKEETEILDEKSCGGYQEGGEVKRKKKVVKEDVLGYILENQMATNVVSAEVLFNHISDEFLESIEEDIMEGFQPLPKSKMAGQANKAYGKEQQAVKDGDEAGANKQMQRRIAMNDPKGRKAQLAKG